MKKKHKQMLLIAGGAVACIVLVAVIGSRFGTPPETTSIVAESSAETEGVTCLLYTSSIRYGKHIRVFYCSGTNSGESRRLHHIRGSD